MFKYENDHFNITVKPLLSGQLFCQAILSLKESCPLIRGVNVQKQAKNCPEGLSLEERLSSHHRVLRREVSLYLANH